MAPTTLSLDDAARLVRDTDTLGVPLGPGQPVSFLHALGERERFDDLLVFGALLVDLFPLFTRPGVHHQSGFYGPAERFLRDSGASIEFVPADFRRFGPLLQQICPRVMATAVAPPAADGSFSLSLHAGATIDELKRAGRDPDRLLVAEVNQRLPHTLGLPPEHPHRLEAADVDIVVDTDRDPVALVDPEPSDVDRAIAEHARTFIDDGCTLQTGIGSIPSTVAGLLADGPGGGYGIHSEMFTTGLMHLHQAGKVANRKGEFDGLSVCTFALGTQDLYRWLDGNEEVRFLPVDVVNAPEVIAANDRLISLNGALGVDLFGQVMADTVHHHQFSGIGGHEDFMAGAGLELEDRSLICLPACATRDGQSLSRIVGQFEPGTVITTPRHQVDVVITEYGIAELQGQTVRERARRLIAIAHPDFRAELTAHLDQLVGD